MRQSFHNLGIYGKDDDILGVGLGSDFCAEHEWGHKGIKTAFGLDDSKIGIERYLIRKIPKSCFVSGDVIDSEGNVFYFLGYSSQFEWYLEKSNNDMKTFAQKFLVGNYRPSCENENGITAFWDENGFLFYVQYKEIRDIMEAAFATRDIMIYHGGAGAFNNGSLNLLIISKLPEEIDQQFKDTHLDNEKLLKVAKATGIEKKLKDAGKGYFDDKGYMALSPRWKNNEKKEVIFWLNPMSQQEDNYGWYEVKDLEQWIKGKGPIPMKSKSED